MNKQLAGGFLLYSSKVYQVDRMFNRANDGRKQPQIGSDVILVVMLLGFVQRMHSMAKLWK